MNNRGLSPITTKYQRVCAWSGIILTVLWTIGLLPVAHFLPPHDPAAEASDIAAIFQRDSVGIRSGMIILLIGGAFFVPFVALIAHHMRRIESASPYLVYAQLIAGTANFLFFLIPPMIWAAMAYRPSHSPDLMQFANDVSWFIFLMPVTPFMVQNLSLGFANTAQTR